MVAWSSDSASRKSGTVTPRSLSRPCGRWLISHAVDPASHQASQHASQHASPQLRVGLEVLAMRIVQRIGLSPMDGHVHDEDLGSLKVMAI